MSTTRQAPAITQGVPRSRKKRAGLPFIIGGAALAVLTFVGVVFYTLSATTAGAGTTPVVVAAKNLSIRVPIQPGDLVVANYHSGDVPPGAFSRVTDLKDTVAAVNITQGQPVTSNLILSSADSVIGPQSAYLPIPTGYVALTIPTGEQQGVAGYIQVGDYISLVAVIAGKTSVNNRTVFTNVRVIRVGAANSATAPVQGNPNTPPQTGGLSSSLTIVVTQCQAEFVGWFLANGTLRYTLESFKDYRQGDVAVDQNCPNVAAAKGVTQADIAAKWPGILN